MTYFSRRGERITVRLPAAQREALRDLAGQLIQLLEPLGLERDASDGSVGVPVDDLELGIGGSRSTPTDAAIARLLPDAYPDAESSSEFRQLTERSLVQRKIEAARLCIESLGSPRTVLDPTSVRAWLRTLTDLRLTIAARLGIESDGDTGSRDARLTAAYDWLGYLQGTLLEVLE